MHDGGSLAAARQPGSCRRPCNKSKQIQQLCSSSTVIHCSSCCVRCVCRWVRARHVHEHGCIKPGMGLWAVSIFMGLKDQSGTFTEAIPARQADTYDSLDDSWIAERIGIPALRRRLLASARGAVLEVRPAARQRCWAGSGSLSPPPFASCWHVTQTARRPTKTLQTLGAHAGRWGWAPGSTCRCIAVSL